MQKEKNSVVKANNSSQGNTFGSRNEQTSLLNYHGSNIAFEEKKGKMMVNATQMAKPFGKRAVSWLDTQQAKDLIQTVSKVRKLTLADLQYVKRGGNNPGTWFQEDVALFFAQWLSPEFYLACNNKLVQLIKQQSLVVEPKYGIVPIIWEGELLYAYTDCLRSLGASTRSSASRRKAKHPQQFKKLFGRNFITGAYFDVLKAYYDYANASLQLKLAI